MRGDTVSAVVGLGHVPEAIRSHDTLASPDYVDLYTVTTSEAADRSPEGWARSRTETGSIPA